MLIEQIAKMMLESHCFEFNSFRQAKELICLNEKFVEYDRLTLIVYKHNLTKEEYSLLCKNLSKLYDYKNYEHERTRKEYVSLYNFIRASHMTINTIAKQEHPDFVLLLENGERYGIEVTEFASGVSKIPHSVLRDYSESSLSEKEIEKSVIEKHGAKAKNIKVYKDRNKLQVYSGSFSITENKENFSKLIIKKSTKYKDVINDFDRFILLCDACDGLDITEEKDVGDIFDMIKEVDFEPNVAIIIMAQKDGEIALFEKQVSSAKSLGN